MENMLAKNVVDRKGLCSSRLLSFAKIGVFKFLGFYKRASAVWFSCL